MFPRQATRSRRILALACLLALASPGPAARAREKPEGRRVFYTGHSFHMYVVPRVDRLASSAGVSGHRTAGTQGIGGSRVIQHWDLSGGKNKAREALTGGKVDVFTMAVHLAIPDQGVENFVDLGLGHNPGMTFLVQASWLPFDLTPPLKAIRDNSERDGTDLAALQAAGDDWRRKLEAQVDALNGRHGRKAVFIVPVGDAVYELRRRVKAKQFPGVDRQAELFRDPIGHGLGHVQALAAYCNFAALYRLSPVGLTLAEPGVTDEQHAVLQRIAWETVSGYGRSGVTP